MSTKHKIKSSKRTNSSHHKRRGIHLGLRHFGITIVVCLVVLATIVLIKRPIDVKAQDASFTFGAAGDYWTGSDFQATVDAVARENPAFQLALGDLSYTPGGEAEWCGRWKASYNNILLITGNHDTNENLGGHMDNYVTHCPFTLGSYTGVYGQQYYFDYPATNPLARIILVRPGLWGDGVISYSTGSTGYVFTQNAIDSARAQGIPWVVVGMHKNYISAMEKVKEVDSNFMKMLLQKKVDLILQGHEHAYERSHQLGVSANCTTLPTNLFDPDCVVDSDNNLVKGAGTVIQIIGTGGVTLRTPANPADPEYPYFAAMDNSTFGFGKFTVSQNQLTYTFVRSAGGDFSDSFTITAPSAPTPSATLKPSPTVTLRASPTPTPSVPITATVTLSPTRTPTPLTGEISLIPIDDTFVAALYPTKTYGKSASLQVGYSPEKIIYLKFDLRSLTSAQIHSAKLRLTVTNASAQTQTLSHVASSAWKETTLTYNLRPALGTTIASIKGGTVGSVVEIDVTQAAKSKVGTYFPLALSTQGSNHLYFASEETLTGKPILLIR